MNLTLFLSLLYAKEIEAQIIQETSTKYRFTKWEHQDSIRTP